MLKIKNIIIILLSLVMLSFSYKEENIKYHKFIFYLDPSLVSDIEFVKEVLPKYVEDMNYILAKNTNRGLTFDVADIVLTTTKPQTDSFAGTLPVEGFDIWAYAVLNENSSYPYSYGGYAGMDQSGAGVIGGLRWIKIYDPDNLISQDEVKDYWTQIDHMLHEIAHIFGAGVGEYYNLSSITDATGIEPLLNINVNDTNDSFWSDKQDFLTDPLLKIATQYFSTYTRSDLLEYTKFSNLTSTIMNGNYRNGFETVDLDNINLFVYADNGQLIDNANVKIWEIRRCSDASNLLIDSYTTNGMLTFSWGSSNPHNNCDFLRLIKVCKDGYEPIAKYVSIFDADIEKLVNGNDVYNIIVTLNSNVTETIVPSVTNTETPTQTLTPTATQTSTLTSTPTKIPTRTKTFTKTKTPMKTKRYVRCWLFWFCFN